MRYPNTYPCSLCGSVGQMHELIDDLPYYLCASCNFLYMPEQYSAVDYDGNYWQNEYEEAARREKEDCCLRALELLYLSKIPVKKMLDFGCGLGITVNWLRSQLGVDAYGIDTYGRFEANEYLLKEDILTTDKFDRESFEAIMSIEVVEHLPQDVIVPIFERLRDLLKPGGLMLINTGTLEFTMENSDNKKYIDPSTRGHISIFSTKTFDSLAGKLGLIHIPMWSRTWCSLFLKPKAGIDKQITPWKCLEVNGNIIRKMSPMFHLVRQSLWAEELNAIGGKWGLKPPQKMKEFLKKWLFRNFRHN